MSAPSNRPPSGPFPVGSLAWERAGGPPLSAGQRVELLGGAAALVAMHYAQKLAWRLRRRGLLPARVPPKVDLAAWAPPDSRAARDAEAHLREVSTPQMVDHSLRLYWFSAIAYDLSAARPPLDREALYVAALMHDVGLFQAAPPAGERCFTVGGARQVRRIGRAAGWDGARQDRAALAVTSNLNPFVSAEEYGAEAHFMSLGGQIEVLAQEWKLHPENLAEILGRYPRAGLADDALAHVARERRRNPGCRFACLHPIFPLMLRASSFSLDGRGGG